MITFSALSSHHWLKPSPTVSFRPLEMIIFARPCVAPSRPTLNIFLIPCISMASVRLSARKVTFAIWSACSGVAWFMIACCRALSAAPHAMGTACAQETTASLPNAASRPPAPEPSAAALIMPRAFPTIGNLSARLPAIFPITAPALFPAMAISVLSMALVSASMVTSIASVASPVAGTDRIKSCWPSRSPPARSEKK